MFEDKAYPQSSPPFLPIGHSPPTSAYPPVRTSNFDGGGAQLPARAYTSQGRTRQQDNRYDQAWTAHCVSRVLALRHGQGQT